MKIKAHMLKVYGYVGIALISTAIINFYFVLQPFADWYIPIIWFGFILFIDSLVNKIKHRSLLWNHPKEFVLILFISIFFWLIFEIYNFFTKNWSYTNYSGYIHIVDFATTLPSLLELSILMSCFIPKINLKIKIIFTKKLLYCVLIIGIIISTIPIIVPNLAFPLIWVGPFLVLDPINALRGYPSVIKTVQHSFRSVYMFFIAGIIGGFLWELWNNFAYPKWIYLMSVPGIFGVKLFAMPLLGYFGYLSFALEAYSFYVFASSLYQKPKRILINVDGTLNSAKLPAKD